MSITAPTTSEYNKFDLQRFLWVLKEKCQTVEKENAPDSLSLWLKRVHMSLLHLPAHLPFPPSLITLTSPAIPLPVFSSSSYTTSPQYCRFRTSETEEAFCLFLFGILSCFPKWTGCCLGYTLRIWLWFGRILAFQVHLGFYRFTTLERFSLWWEATPITYFIILIPTLIPEHKPNL